MLSILIDKKKLFIVGSILVILLIVFLVAFASQTHAQGERSVLCYGRIIGVPPGSNYEVLVNGEVKFSGQVMDSEHPPLFYFHSNEDTKVLIEGNEFPVLEKECFETDFTCYLGGFYPWEIIFVPGATLHRVGSWVLLDGLQFEVGETFPAYYLSLHSVFSYPLVEITLEYIESPWDLPKCVTVVAG